MEEEQIVFCGTLTRLSISFTSFTSFTFFPFVFHLTHPTLYHR